MVENEDSVPGCWFVFFLFFKDFVFPKLSSTWILYKVFFKGILFFFLPASLDRPVQNTELLARRVLKLKLLGLFCVPACGASPAPFSGLDFCYCK